MIRNVNGTSRSRKRTYVQIKCVKIKIWYMAFHINIVEISNRKMRSRIVNRRGQDSLIIEGVIYSSELSDFSINIPPFSRILNFTNHLCH